MSGGEPLRVLFATQSTGLNLFWNLINALRADSPLGPCGFMVTNHYEFAVFECAHPEFGQSGLDVLREWDLLEAAARLDMPDLARIEHWEYLLGDASLWNALIIDRRMGYPLKAQFTQSYAPAYGHEQLLKILTIALEAIDAQFERIRPHAVLGLNAVTLYDYLYYRMAKLRNIPYMQLKLTRVRNYVSWFTSPFSLSPHITEVYRRYLAEGAGDEKDEAAMREADAFLDAARDQTLVYEGAINRPGAKPSEPAKAPAIRRLAVRASAWKPRVREAVRLWDPHYPTLIQTFIQARIMRPLRRRFRRFRFDIEDARSFVAACQVGYAVYPLNTEPEVALLAFGRPYRNQIETVRNLAAALPVGWKLVVKEHPNAYGYRTTKYYRKLKQIPNVLLAGPTADTGALTDGAGLVALVYGTIGLEAIIKQKPVLIFSEAPYGVFPMDMVRLNVNPWHLGQDIRQLLDTYRYDEAQVRSYVAAHIRTGIRVNLFTGLLAKSGRQSGELGKPLDEQYRDLAVYTRQRIAEEQGQLAQDRQTDATG